MWLCQLCNVMFSANVTKCMLSKKSHSKSANSMQNHKQFEVASVCILTLIKIGSGLSFWESFFEQYHFVAYASVNLWIYVIIQGSILAHSSVIFVSLYIWVAHSLKLHCHVHLYIYIRVLISVWYRAKVCIIYCFSWNQTGICKYLTKACHRLLDR